MKWCVDGNKLAEEQVKALRAKDLDTIEERS
jgi:hypothetical protein